MKYTKKEIRQAYDWINNSGAVSNTNKRMMFIVENFEFDRDSKTIKDKIDDVYNYLNR